VSNSENNFIDNKTFKLSDLDLEFVATNASGGGKKSNPRVPERQLVRYQFMEVLVRLALDKYLKSKPSSNLPGGICETQFEAVKTAFQDHFLNFFKKNDS